MTAVELATLFLAHFLAVAVIGAIAITRGGTRLLGATLVVFGVLGVGVVTFIGAAQLNGGNFLVQSAIKLAGLNRPVLSATALGVGLAVPWTLLLSRGRMLGAVAGLGFAAVVVTGLAVAGKEIISPFLPHPEQTVGGGAVNRDVDAAFTLEFLGNLTSFPVRVAVHPDTGEVYIAGQIGLAGQSGAIMRLEFDQRGRIAAERVIAPMLNRPFGLALRGNDIYVSRSGQYTRFVNGKAEQTNTGAVTLLRDLDGDGRIDYYHDIVTGLPGARAPDYLHQNNAIAFGPEGELYMTSAISSDGHPARHPWEGTILRATAPDYDDVEVFAKGLRNTFGLVMDEGVLYATDNDSQSGELAGLGDKLMEVRKGDDFGHPYAAPGQSGVTLPLHLSKFALAGLTTSRAGTLPVDYRGDLFVVSYGEGRVLRFDVERAGQARATGATPHPFAIVPAATDIAAAPDGSFYVISFENQTLHRIRPRTAGD